MVEGNMEFRTVVLVALVATFSIGAANATYARSHAPDCKKIVPALHLNVKGDDPLYPVQSHDNCHTRTSNGFLLPDAGCTPGAVNPSLKLATLRSKLFKTGCVRDKNTSAGAKDKTYDWYGIDHPANNTGQHQTCEKDHLVSLELGGADSLDNIWPQCGPTGFELAKRYFKIKDGVEDYLAAQVRAGRMGLREAQEGIAKNWTLYLHDSQDYWKSHKRPAGGGE